MNPTQIPVSNLITFILNDTRPLQKIRVAYNHMTFIYILKHLKHKRNKNHQIMIPLCKLLQKPSIILTEFKGKGVAMSPDLGSKWVPKPRIPGLDGTKLGGLIGCQALVGI